MKIPYEEIETHVAYLCGLCSEEETYRIADIKNDFFEARKYWDSEFYVDHSSSFREEKYVDKGGNEWFILLDHIYD